MNRVAAAATVAVLLVACGGQGGDGAAPLESSSDSVADTPGTSDPSEVAPGTSEVAPDDVGDPDHLSATNCAGQLTGGVFPSVPCDQPHASEFAGYAPAPWDVLPDDAEEAFAAMAAACRPVVEEFLGRPLNQPGPGMGTSVDSAGLGEPVDGDVECFVTTGGDTTLVGLIAEVGFADALNGVVVINDLEPGACFQLGEDAFAFGAPVDCGESDALMHLGSFEVDAGPYPGEDELRAIRNERCVDILAGSGLAVDANTVSGTFPGEVDWTRQDQRTITCDATPF